MTKDQIQMLRELIQAEIAYETEEWSYEYGRKFYSDTTEKWEKFAETFNSTPTDSLYKFKDSELAKLIWDKFVINAKELDDESKKVLYDNLWDLYITGEKND